MAARKTRPRARARRSSHRLPVLEQRHADLIGLGLVALSVFVAFVLYGGWQGGRAGEALVEGLGWLVGAVRYPSPVAFAVTRAVLVLRPVLSAHRTLHPRRYLLFAARSILLIAGAFSAGTCSQ